MPKVLAIAKYFKYRGSFTNNKLVWQAIETLENRAVTDSCEPINSLVIRDDEKGKIEGILPSGTPAKFTEATYAHLCTVLRRDGKVAFHSDTDFSPIYAVWIGEMNEIYTEGNEND